MEPEDLMNNGWIPRGPRLHGLDNTDAQIAPGKDIEGDWMSLSPVQMHMVAARTKGDEMYKEYLRWARKKEEILRKLRKK